MNPSLQTTCPRRLLSLAPPLPQRRPEYLCQRARNRSKRSTPHCRSSSRRVRTQRAPCAKSSLEGRMTRRRSGSVGSLPVGSSHASGSGGIGRPSRAGGDAARAGVNASNETVFALRSLRHLPRKSLCIPYREMGLSRCNTMRAQVGEM